ncbi:Sensor histidine kinase YpdA [Eisenbergiella tayi]|uniref:Sensor histidine kinase YpdA n=2 Tax=Eisenbergiella tayi TaxID=1432052 RepID=A0A1E3AJX7_9FIRM|nr:Sensor histidine kinase YpdA [Eisenbergiella tayi]
MRTWVHKIIEWYSSRKLKEKTTALFAVILCTYVLVIFVIYQFIIKANMDEYIYNANKDVLNSVEKNIMNSFSGGSTVSKWIMNSKEVLYFLNTDDVNKLGITYDALSVIYEFTIAEKALSSVYIFRNDGIYISINNGVTYLDKSMMDSAWHEEINRANGGYIIKINGGGAFRQISGKPVISLIRTIYDINSQKPVGIIVINYFDDILKSSYSEFDDTEKEFTVFDLQGNIIEGSEKLEKYSDEIREGNISCQVTAIDKNVFIKNIPNTPIGLAEKDNTSAFQFVAPRIIISIIVFILVTLFGFFILGLFIKFSITNPVESLVSSMREVKTGWLRRVSIKLPNDEIGELKNSYNTMLVEINRLIEELVEKEKAYQKAEMNALQEQIKPHFLYNTLETIALLALENPRDEVYDAIETLGKFYRKFLSKGQEEITLSDEVEIVKNYLKLQELRYGDIFHDIYDIDEKVKNVRIPRLILQPIVENALYHGIIPKGEEGNIYINAKQKEDKLVITVKDTGIGASEERISEVLSKKSQSFGLKSTLDRISKYYSNKVSYKISSEVGYYFEVEIYIPLEELKYE